MYPFRPFNAKVPQRSTVTILILFLLTGRLLAGSTALAQKDIESRDRHPSGASSGAAKLRYSRAHAVIIGVSRYKNVSIPLLQYADDDAQEIYNILTQCYGFDPKNITLLLNERATKEAIDTALNDLTDDERISKTDCVLIFFSGHGQTVQLRGGGDTGFLIPYGADVDWKNLTNPAPYRKTCVSMTDVWQTLDLCPAQHVLVLADACYSGLLAVPRTLLPSLTEKLDSPAIAANLERRGRQVLTAGAKGQKSYEYANLAHGAFTYKILENLRAYAATSQTFSIMNIAAFVKSSVPNVTEGRQTPQFANYEGNEGDFLFTSLRPFRTPGIAAAAVVNSARYRSSSSYQAAEAAFRAGRTGPAGEARFLLRPLAEAGDARAQALLGDCLDDLQATREAAFLWYQRAAEQGDTFGQVNLGWMYEVGFGIPGKADGEGKNLSLARQWYARGLPELRRQAEQGDGLSQYQLAHCYYSGNGVAKNLETAVQWYRKAAEQDYVSAQDSLGDCYYSGNGVAKDLVEAVKWYRKAAEQDYAWAQISLGNCYHSGNGVAKNLETAVQWYRKAAEQGNASAQNGLGVCYYSGNGVAKNLETAVLWYRKAAEQGYAWAQNNLGDCYYSGNGVAKDPVEAVKWYRKAAEQGNASAQNGLGNCYHSGNGVAKNLETAVLWYRKAAEQDYAWAQNNLGVCYENGFGVAKDLVEAVKWYRKAAEQGNEDAKSTLKRLGR